MTLEDEPNIENKSFELDDVKYIENDANQAFVAGNNTCDSFTPIDLPKSNQQLSKALKSPTDQ